MGKFRNFELDEFLASATAKALRIDNTPTFEVVEHLDELVGTLLQPLRDAWGSGIKVTSGYRCPELNNSIKGASRTSVHQIGYAADLVPSNGDLDGFIRFVEDFLKGRDIAFDQLIKEKGANGSRWLHIGLKSNSGEQRREIKTITL